jgi:hypothetical protein
MRFRGSGNAGAFELRNEVLPPRGATRQADPKLILATFFVRPCRMSQARRRVGNVMSGGIRPRRRGVRDSGGGSEAKSRWRSREATTEKNLIFPKTTGRSGRASQP